MPPSDSAIHAELARAARQAQGRWCPVRRITISALRACTGCGLLTYGYCDNECLADEYMPDEDWYSGQGTPLCTACDKARGECHYCRQEGWCTPGPHRDKSLPSKGKPCVHESNPTTTQEATDFSDEGMHWTPEQLVTRMARGTGNSPQAIIQQCQAIAIREMYGGDMAAFYRNPARDEFTEWLRLMAIMRPKQSGLQPTNTSVRVNACDSTGYTWMHKLPE
jgi:hypothetical protein